MNLRVLSYNIHKGLSSGNRRFILRGIREALRKEKPDLVFLQEILGGPESAQLAYLAEEFWAHAVYGQNAVYSGGNHGNAILSRYPIRKWENIDISVMRRERRGLLHTWIDYPGIDVPLHAICVHLGLLEGERSTQLRRICDRIREHVKEDEALIVAGDFNDWKLRASRVFRQELGLIEAFEKIRGSPARSFPSWLPALRLDRIYFRGLQPALAKSLKSAPWARLSDHLALLAELRTHPTPRPAPP